MEDNWNNQANRDAQYRIAALECAVIRVGQDGGISNEKVDVLDIANTYYHWLTGNHNLTDPIFEKVSKKKAKK